MEVCYLRATGDFFDWGERMFNAIVENMQGAKESGDLYQGSVSQTPKEQKPEGEMPFIEEVIKEPQPQVAEEHQPQTAADNALTEAEEILKQDPLYESEKMREVGL